MRIFHLCQPLSCSPVSQFVSRLLPVRGDFLIQNLTLLIVFLMIVNTVKYGWLFEKKGWLFEKRVTFLIQKSHPSIFILKIIKLLYFLVILLYLLKLLRVTFLFWIFDFKNLTLTQLKPLILLHFLGVEVTFYIFFYFYFKNNIIEIGVV